MLLRLTGKLSRKIHEQPLTSLPLAPKQICGWSANVFMANDIQYILAMHTTSYFSVLFPGKGIRSADHLLDALEIVMEEEFARFDLAAIAKWHILPGFAEVAFSKSLNASVVASMNDLADLASSFLEEDYPINEVASRLNTRPLRSLGFRFPSEVIQDIVPLTH